MSTSFEKIFTNTTILQSYVVYLNNQELLEEDILSFELAFNFDKPYVEGNIMLKDSFGLADLDYFDGTTTFKVYASDMYGEIFSRVFRITSIAFEEYNERFQSFRFGLIDEFYYTLANTYISKSFSKTDPTAAFQEYLTELNLDTYLSDNKVEKNFEETSAYSFVVPQDRSAYEFFSYEFRQNGLRFYQDRYTVNIKKVDFNALEFIQVDYARGTDHLKFSNNTENNEYGWKIHDWKLIYNDILTANLKRPIQEHQMYDITKKAIDNTTNNLKEVYGTMQQSDKDFSTLQHTNGAKYVTDADIYIDKQKVQIEDLYNKNTTLEIVVPGNYKYNRVGMLVDVVLKGNPYMNDSALLGDKVHSGVYMVAKITDRYIGNKLLQKVVLNRIDLNKPRVNA